MFEQPLLKFVLCLNLSRCGIICVSVLMLMSLRIFQDRHVGSTNGWWDVVSKAITKVFFGFSGSLYIDMLIHEPNCIQCFFLALIAWVVLSCVPHITYKAAICDCALSLECL
jgi:hypothetical protein